MEIPKEHEFSLKPILPIYSNSVVADAGAQGLIVSVSANRGQAM